MHVYLNKTINIKIIIVAFPLQGIMWPQVITGILANLINALLNYIFIFPLNMGIQWVLPSLPRSTLSRTLLALPHEIICDHSSFAEDLPLPTRCPRPPCLCCSSCTLFAEVSTRPLGEVSSLQLVSAACVHSYGTNYKVVVHDSCFRWNSSSVCMACMGVKAVSFIFPIKVSCEK